MTHYPELERGESASETGRDHIPPRVYKQAAHLNKQGEYILGLLDSMNAFNSKKVAEELEAALKKFFPAMGRFVTQTKKYDAAIRSLKSDKTELEKELKDSKAESYHKLLAEAKLAADYENLQRVMEKIPPEIVFKYAGRNQNHDKIRGLER